MLSIEWLSAFAPVGHLRANNEWAAFGASVFFHKPPSLWLITARHVLEKVGRHALSILVTRSAGEGVIVVEVGKILSGLGFAWVEDVDNDLAAAPMPMSSDFGIKPVTPENCLAMTDVVPSMPCFTVGCPYGLHGLNPQKATPLVLDGVISGMDPVSRKIYTSAPTFPGNSGGPLIALRSRSECNGAIFGPPTVLFAGIMLQTVLVPSGDPACYAPAVHSGYVSPPSIPSGVEGYSRSHLPPLHLGVAAPADAVLALLDSEPARTLTARITALAPGR
jgi:trypsin-like peptidase